MIHQSNHQLLEYLLDDFKVTTFYNVKTPVTKILAYWSAILTSPTVSIEWNQGKEAWSSN